MSIPEQVALVAQMQTYKHINNYRTPRQYEYSQDVNSGNPFYNQSMKQT